MVTSVGVAAGLASFAGWLATGNQFWLTIFFQGPGLVLMVGLAAVQAWLSITVRGAFLPDEPLHLAWTLIAASALFDFLGAVCTQWLGSTSVLNPFLHAPGWPPGTVLELRQLGLTVGTLRYGLLAAGLVYVLRIYRKAGFLGRLTTVDWLLIVVVFAYLVDEGRDVVLAIGRGKSPGWREILAWPVDPLMFLLLCETRLLARSIERMGTGIIGRCWKAFTIGILLVWLGDLGNLATTWAALPWQWTSFSWYVWLPAAGAFAVAPAYQMDAIDQAMQARAGDSSL